MEILIIGPDSKRIPLARELEKIDAVFVVGMDCPPVMNILSPDPVVDLLEIAKRYNYRDLILPDEPPPGRFNGPPAKRVSRRRQLKQSR